MGNLCLSLVVIYNNVYVCVCVFEGVGNILIIKEEVNLHGDL